MQTLTAFGPIIAFYAAYKIWDIYVATATLMVCMLILVLVDWLRTRKIPPLHGASTILVMIFGGLTLWLRDAQFIQWKPTLLFGLFAVVHFGSQWVGKSNLAEKLMKEMAPEFAHITARDWRTINLGCAGFYAVMAVSNYWVAHWLSMAAWVNFKAFGMLAMTVVFFLGLSFWMTRRPEVANAAHAPDSP